MSENSIQNNSKIVYELTQKNEQIEFLINENNQYSQLVYNLQSEIFSLKNKLTDFNNISLQLKLSKEKNIELENKIKSLSKEILNITKHNKEEKRKTQLKFYDDLKKVKLETEGFKSKIEMANHLANEKNGLMHAFEKIVQDKNDILKERDKKLIENKINSELKISNLKKKMIDTVNEAQEKVNELNLKYVDFKTKLTLLQYQQTMIKYQHQNEILNELTKKNKILEKENFELKKDLEIHKEVEYSLAEKYKQLRKTIEIKKTNLTSYNNNFRKTDNNLDKEANKTILKMHKKILNLENALSIKQNKFEEEKIKLDSIEKYLKENEKKYLGIFNLLEECLKSFFNDDYLKSKKEIYIHIETLKKGDFSQLTKEEKYATLVILMKYLMPMIAQNNNYKFNNINTKFHFVNNKNNIKYLVGNSLDTKKNSNFFNKIMRKKIFKKNETNLELPYNFSFNSFDNSLNPSERLSFISTKKTNNK